MMWAPLAVVSVFAAKHPAQPAKQHPKQAVTKQIAAKKTVTTSKLTPKKPAVPVKVYKSNLKLFRERASK